MIGAEEQYKLECFARWLLRERSLHQRRQLIRRREEEGQDTSALKAELIRQHELLGPPDETAERARAVRAQIESMRKLGEARP